MNKTISVLLLSFFFMKGPGSGQLIAQSTDDAGREMIQKGNKVGFDLMFDPVGFLTFGPMLQAELLPIPNLGLVGGFRIQNLGLATNLFFGGMKFSYMGRFSPRYYFNPGERIKGFFMGPGIEYGRSTYSGGTKYNARAFGVEFGYKWRTKKGVTIEISDNIGVIQSQRIYDSDYFFKTSYSMSSSLGSWNTDAFVFYMLSVKFGKSF